MQTYSVCSWWWRNLRVVQTTVGDWQRYHCHALTHAVKRGVLWRCDYGWDSVTESWSTSPLSWTSVSWRLPSSAAAATPVRLFFFLFTDCIISSPSLGAVYVLHPRPSVCLSVRLFVRPSIPVLCRLLNVPKHLCADVRLTGGRPALRRLARRNRLAILGCVRC